MKSVNETGGGYTSNDFNKISENKKKRKNDDSSNTKDSESEYLFYPSAMIGLGTRLIEDHSDVGIDDFKYVSFLGKGAFGTVDLVR
jgi:hypothetical protein